MPKLTCSQDQLLKLAKKHTTSDCRVPLAVDVLLRLGGRLAVVDRLCAGVNYRTQFCELSYEVNPAEGEVFHLRCWNWPEQVHHSTLVIYSDSKYKIQVHTELGERYSPDMWRHFMRCAAKDTFFVMPREVKL